MKKTKYIVPLFLLSLIACNTKTSRYFTNNGVVYGTYYSIKYENPEGTDIQKEIDTQFAKYTQIFSHYAKNSTITKINKNKEVNPEPEFMCCFNRAMEISKITNGAFDITAAPLINAWGFGPEAKQKMTQHIVDSLKTFTGYKKIQFADGQFIKENPNIQLNMSAISKGYTCDLIGNFLSQKGCKNYLVDIGGEVVAKGINRHGKAWTIGIRKPEENPLKNDLEAKIKLPNHALATSGNYLNFYVENGKKYAHTIDPSSGYPVQHSLLSATVLANDCMTADAFATAFMVLGKEKGIEIAAQIPDLEIFFIYADEKGNNRTYMSKGFKPFLIEKE